MRHPALHERIIDGTRSFFLPLNNTKAPFNDVRVRQAANHAIDKKLIIDRILNGRGVPLDNVISPQSFGYNKDVARYEFSQDKARKLMRYGGVASARMQSVLDAACALQQQVADEPQAPFPRALLDPLF